MTYRDPSHRARLIRESFRLLYKEGLIRREIAIRLGVPYSTVTNWLEGHSNRVVCIGGSVPDDEGYAEWQKGDCVTLRHIADTIKDRDLPDGVRFRIVQPGIRRYTVIAEAGTLKRERDGWYLWNAKYGKWLWSTGIPPIKRELRIRVDLDRRQPIDSGIAPVVY